MVRFSASPKNEPHSPSRASEASAKGREVVHFSGFARKMNHIPPLARAKRAREPAV
ncbi:MAG: hypothetical protein U5L45_17995 [Saprospiraceae bacterium]|nr:hypothetical protein [Saprospiraceae bacterium]